MQIAGLTNTGRERVRNEDNFLIKKDRHIALVAVADGMGGHLAGNVASSLAVSTAERFWQNMDRAVVFTPADARAVMNELLLQANRAIYEEANHSPGKRGMGTTFTSSLFYDGKLTIGHVGDSRAYLIENETIYLLTRDHSLLEELIEAGEIRPEEAHNHPQKHVLTRALGTVSDPEIDITEFEPLSDSVLLLCTDGLTNLVMDDEILYHALNEPDPHTLSEGLINLANSRGGHDNITVVIATGIGGRKR